jgi:hypothetical protein
MAIYHCKDAKSTAETAWMMRRCSQSHANLPACLATQGPAVWLSLGAAHVKLSLSLTLTPIPTNCSCHCQDALFSSHRNDAAAQAC